MSTATHRSPAKRKDSPSWNVALLYPLEGHWTESDYFALEAKSGNRMIELANGCLKVLPMPSPFHQDIVAYLYSLLNAFVLANKLGRVYFAPLPIRLWPGQIHEPDIVFFERNRIKNKHKAPDGADLVIEVVSPGDEARERDLIDKRADYARANIREYWIIDPETRTVTVLTLSGRSYKAFGELKIGETAASKLLKGFTVDIAEMFAAGDQN